MALTFKQKRQRKLSISKLLALALVGLILLLGSNAFSQQMPSAKILNETLSSEIHKDRFQTGGTFKHSQTGKDYIWVLDSVTGQVRYCYMNGCGPWLGRVGLGRGWNK